MIFIDSDAFIGLIIPTDALHTAALKQVDKLTTAQEDLITSWETIDEVCTKLSYYHGKKIAARFLDYLESSRIKIEYVTPVVAKKTLEIFGKQTSKNISLTDCANVAICRSLGITHIFSFDPHYSQNGLKLLS
ncbi:MAG: hypothetical protein UX80_C0032G0013 [Candidatus Amesbacteria bacterium GW2011_GWA2_47_11b]|uniref:PIN domain-containing protein n=1 Tax=Candidatus Amesbacteria bacterium GW2011_GWA2_47_11b TaxID=1618358 RepID=A0A0G1RHV1_9BACT|nr:MAG: hypothetical protein UX80_C0032G0013 [Candidatus Amesbacteria bacterium GW2011_GWA2_47_11b]